MNHSTTYLRSLLVAVVLLALSASLAFGARQPTPAASAPGSGAVLLGEDGENPGEEATGEDADGDEEEDGEGAEGAEEDLEGVAPESAGKNCATDPTLLSDAELLEMRHGSIVCWAAHQTEWPAWFTGHGPFVKCWAHHGKADAPSCTEDPAAGEADGETVDEGTDDGGAGTLRGNGGARGKGKGKPQNH